MAFLNLSTDSHNSSKTALKNCFKNDLSTSVFLLAKSGKSIQTYHNTEKDIKVKYLDMQKLAECQNTQDFMLQCVGSVVN